MKKIKLTKGQFALVDYEDYDWITQWKWYALNPAAGIYYAYRRKIINKKVYDIAMHKTIMRCSSNLVDHINGNSLDNRKENLRICTKQQNNMNRPGDKNTSSKYKGVSWNKLMKKWTAQITINGKSQTLGSYAKEKDAARIYDSLANKIHNKFARLNFKDELLTEDEFKKLYSRKPKSSMYMGVSYYSPSDVWSAKMTINGISRSFGYYKTEEDAAKIYDYWGTRYPNKVTKLNFPNELLTTKEFNNIDSRKNKAKYYE